MNAKLIFLTLCNELWKLKLKGTVKEKKEGETESVQFKFPDSFLISNQYATVQFNEVKDDEIGKVILRFYFDALKKSNTYDYIQNKYDDKYNVKNEFAKYKGYSNEQYLEFIFKHMDSDRKILKDIKTFFFKLSSRLEKNDGYLLLHLDPNIAMLPTSIK
jgi:hypothetical protein